MNEHLKKSETELNELLAEYWKLRRETGTFPSLPLTECIDNLKPNGRHIHGDSGQQVEHASHIRVIEVYIIYMAHLQYGRFIGVICIWFFTLHRVRIRQFDNPHKPIPLQAVLLTQHNRGETDTKTTISGLKERTKRKNTNPFALAGVVIAPNHLAGHKIQ